MSVPTISARTVPVAKHRVMFGSSDRKNVVYTSAGRDPAGTGGLEAVSRSIPAAIAQYTDKDMRVVVPYLAALAREDAALIQSGKPEDTFQRTGITIPVADIEGKTEEFEVLQRFEPIAADKNKPKGEQRGNWVYAIKNEKLFDTESLFVYPPASKDAAEASSKTDSSQMPIVKKDPVFAKPAIYSRAVAAFLPYLNQNGPRTADESQLLRRFGSDNGSNGQLNALITNDWHTGAVSYEMPANSDVRYIFMVHNSYDEPRMPSYAADLGLKVPKNASDDKKDVYSPLNLGMLRADAVIANGNFVKTLTDTPFAQGAKFVETLKAKQAQKALVDMHHGLSEGFSLSDNAALRELGFTELKPGMQVSEFKKLNKQALQQKLGLKVDPNAVVMSWAARLDPDQKGFKLLLDSVVELLKKYPNLQLVIAGSTPKNDSDLPTPLELAVNRVRAEVEQDPALKGRLNMLNKFIRGNGIPHINAGSDFSILPSLYEPYGLTQLEAMQMGTVPIVHGVDGLLSTVYDPTVKDANLLARQKEEKSSLYKQTGVLMEPMPVVAYRNAVARQDKLEAFENLLDRAQTNSFVPTKKDALRPLADLVENAMKNEAKTLNTDELKQLKDIHTELMTATAPALTRSMLDTLQGIFKAKDTAVMETARRSFMDAMDRAMTLAADTKLDSKGQSKLDRIRKHGMKYVKKEHSWKSIVERYKTAIDGDVSSAQNPEPQDKSFFADLKKKMAAALTGSASAVTAPGSSSPESSDDASQATALASSEKTSTDKTAPAGLTSGGEAKSKSVSPEPPEKSDSAVENKTHVSQTEKTSSTKSAEPPPSKIHPPEQAKSSPEASGNWFSQTWNSIINTLKQWWESFLSFFCKGK